jgi:hypothetical protein
MVALYAVIITFHIEASGLLAVSDPGVVTSVSPS